MGIAAPSKSGSVDSSALAAGGTPGSAPERKDSCSGRVRASAGGMTSHCSRHLSTTWSANGSTRSATS